MSDDIARQPASVGELRLCPARRLLIGPHGQVELDATPYALAELLMRQPGEVVEAKVLIAVMPRDVTQTPGGAAPALTKQVSKLRGAILVLTRNAVRVRTEREMGYAIEVRR